MKVTGRVFINVGSERLRSKEGASLNLGGVQRNVVKGDTGVHGYAEEVMEPFIECTISHVAETDLQALADTTDQTITFEADTGDSWVLRNAWLENTVQLTGGTSGAEVPLKFVGMSAEQVT